MRRSRAWHFSTSDVNYLPIIGRRRARSGAILCIPQIPSAWPRRSKSGRFCRAGPAQPDQVDAPRLGSVQDLDRGRERSPASSAKRAVSECYEAPCPQNA